MPYPLAADGLPQSITVPCPRCKARAGQSCKAVGNEPGAGYHVERIRATPGRKP